MRHSTVMEGHGAVFAVKGNHRLVGITSVLEEQRKLIKTERVGILKHIAFASWKLDLACPNLLGPFWRQGIHLIKTLGSPASGLVQ